jgi:hypothetical protein
MNTIRLRGLQRSFWTSTLLVIGFVLFQSHTAVAQQTVTTPGGTIGKIPKWTAASSLTDSVIYDNGNVGIGTTNPGSILDVYGAGKDVRLASSTDAAHGFLVAPAYDWVERAYLYTTGGNTDHAGHLRLSNGNSNITIADILLRNAAGATVNYITNSGSSYFNGGNVGIGTTAPNSLLNVGGIGDAALNPGRPNSIWTISSGTYNSVGIIASTQAEVFYKVSSGGTDAKWFQQYSRAGDLGFRSLTDAYQIKNETLFLTNSGKVGIGTTSPSATLHVIGTATVSGNVATGDITTGNINATGNISATGVINAKYQDVSEWVPASHAISAGTVVVLDPEQSNHVLPSSRAYDTSVAGVVSARPGVILGEGGAGKVMVATTGRVRVKVDATNAPIRVGDLLVTSDKEGVAMRSQPLELGGTPIHRPGTLIGKALEPLEKGVGEILVLLSLQ